MEDHYQFTKTRDRTGQTQLDRYPSALDPNYVRLDERSPRDLFELMKRWGENLRYFPADPRNSLVSNWAHFFPDAIELDQQLSSDRGRVPPHVALMLAFLEMYKEPQALLNELTEKHLDYYYRDILRLAPQPVEPGRAYLVLKLKKTSAPVVVNRGTRFVAKTQGRIEREASPISDEFVSQVQVDALRMAFIDPMERTLRITKPASAPVGLADPGSTSAEGEINLSELASVGFAIGSPLLRLKEGQRILKVRLTLADSTPTVSLENIFDLSLTSREGWFAVEAYASQLSPAGELSFDITLPASAPAVVDYDPQFHGPGYQATVPLLRFLLRQTYSTMRYAELRDWSMNAAQLEVRAENLMDLAVDSEGTPLDPSKPFFPFGAVPSRDSVFHIRSDEAFGKSLSRLALTLKWKAVPEDLKVHYQGYGIDGITNEYFAAAVTVSDDLGQTLRSETKPLFAAGDARREQVLNLDPQPGSIFDPTLSAGPKLFPRITIKLLNDDGFLQATFRRRQIETMLGVGTQPGSAVPIIPLEPYIPIIQSLKLSYSAVTQPLLFSSVEKIDSLATKPTHACNIDFHQVGVLGARCVVRNQRLSAAQAENAPIALLPAHQDREIYIGLSGAEPGQRISLLIKVNITGGTDGPPPIWNVLRDNTWRVLPNELIWKDTTHGLRKTGILALTLPADLSLESTYFPSGRIWLRATLPSGSGAMRTIAAVYPNAIEVTLSGTNSQADFDFDQLIVSSATPWQVQPPVAAIATVRQPLDSFASRPAETMQAFRARVAERLRHKNRCVSAWDFERVALERFPVLHWAKCVPHTNSSSRLNAGSVLLVVIPKLRGDATPASPSTVDLQTLGEIGEHLRRRAGMQVNVLVRNARYKIVQVNFQVRYKQSVLALEDTESCRNRLIERLEELLSPWCPAPLLGHNVSGTIYKAVLLQAVLRENYVEHVENFRLETSGVGESGTDLNEVHSETSDTVFIPGKHRIEVLPFR